MITAYSPATAEIVQFVDVSCTHKALRTRSSGAAGATPDLNWLAALYGLVQANKEAEAIDVIYNQIDDLLVAGKLAECNEVLANVDVGRLDITTTLAVLSITPATMAELTNRQRFATMAARKVRAEAPDRAEALLAGLI